MFLVSSRLIRPRRRRREAPLASSPLTRLERGSAIEAWNRVDRQLAVDALEIFEVEAILPATSETLEADEGTQRGKGGGWPCSFDSLEEADDRLVHFGGVGNQEVRALGGAQVSVGDDAEAADHHMTALASAMAPSRSGPESSSRGMTGLHGGDEQGDRLLGEMAVGDPLVHRERGGELGFLARLFLVDLRPASVPATTGRTSA